MNENHNRRFSNISISAELNYEERHTVEKLVTEFKGLLSRTPEDVVRTKLMQHRIDTTIYPPIKQHLRRLPFAKMEEVIKLLKEMQQNDVIEPSTCPWASPIVLVQKKDGLPRFCLDYRRLNDIKKKNRYPLPEIDKILDILTR